MVAKKLMSGSPGCIAHVLQSQYQHTCKYCVDCLMLYSDNELVCCYFKKKRLYLRNKRLDVYESSYYMRML